MRRLSIPTRIFLAFALVLTSFGAVALSSVMQHDRTARLWRLQHDGYLPLAIRIGFAQSNQQAHRQHLERVADGSRWVRMALTATVRQGRPATIRRLEHRLERAETLARRTGDSLTMPPVWQALARVKDAQEASIDDYDRLFAALDTGAERQVTELVARLGRQEAAVERQYARAAAHLQDRIDDIGAQAAAQERQAAVILGVLSALALLLGVLMTWWSRRMLAPLPQLQERVAAVARGDLTSAALPGGDDELARLAADFEKMVRALAARDERLAELRRMQEQIVAGLSAAVVVIDAEDRVRVVNAAAEQVLGLSEESVGGSAEPLCERVGGLASAMECVRLEHAPLALEAEPVEARFVDVLVTPFGDGPDEVLIVADDVTEALRTKARLIHTERLAAIGRMAAHVTHEVRNPLSSIGLNAEMLEDELPPGESEGRALLRAIQREIDRLTDITEEYLRLARLPPPRLEASDLRELIDSVARFVRPEIERGGLRLEVAAPEELSLVAIDESQLRQALLNLLRNAREAMEEGAIRLGLIEQDGDVVLRIDDEGMGIDPAKREHIFDLFYTTKERGTGLGLPLTHQIVAAHGGQIRCAEAPGGGTRFELRLPALANDARRAPAAE